MSGQFATGIRVFLSAHVSAGGWILAGCGWGVVIGSALEAVFGQGAHELLDAAGEISIEATVGALAGMAAGVLLMTVPLVGTLVSMIGEWQRGRMPVEGRAEAVLAMGLRLNTQS